MIINVAQDLKSNLAWLTTVDTIEYENNRETKLETTWFN